MSNTEQTKMDGKMAVAQTITHQIGGAALCMLGASMFVGGENDLQFRVQGSRKVSLLRVVLEASDTYRVEGWKGRSINLRMVAQMNDVYAEQLRDVIAMMTGLAVSL